MKVNITMGKGTTFEHRKTYEIVDDPTMTMNEKVNQLVKMINSDKSRSIKASVPGKTTFKLNFKMKK